jgi:large subunit ribosomal protein L24
VRVIKGDIVEVQVGNQAAAERPARVRGKVLRIIPEKGKVVVEGVNRRFKHVRRSQKYPQGGRIQREVPIDLSNVMPVCPKCDKGVRVSYKDGDNGAKSRICRTCGTVLHQMRKAKT